MKRNDMITENIPITAYCVLHNFCEIYGNSFHDSWLDNATDNQYPQSSSGATGGPSSSNVPRNTLMEYLYQQQ